METDKGDPVLVKFQGDLKYKIVSYLGPEFLSKKIESMNRCRYYKYGNCSLYKEEVTCDGACKDHFNCPLDESSTL